MEILIFISGLSEVQVISEPCNWCLKWDSFMELEPF